MGTKLIIVEGLPGSGKSTTAQLVSDILNKNGIKTELFSEGNYNHPADFEGVAYFSKNEFQDLKLAFMDESSILSDLGIQYYNGYIVEYRKSIEENQVKFSERLLNEILKHDIYELQLEINIELIKKRWSDFVNSCANMEKIIIFECCFIQNPVTVSFIRSNSTESVSVSYIMDLESIILPLKPLLIYVEQQDFKKSFEKAIKERQKEWIEGFTKYYTAQGYGLSNQLFGIEGVLKVLEERKNLEVVIYNSLEIDKLRIDNSDFNYDFYKDTLIKEINKYI